MERSETITLVTLVTPNFSHLLLRAPNESLKWLPDYCTLAGFVRVSRAATWGSMRQVMMGERV